jgi:hypothetical protein
MIAVAENGSQQIAGSIAQEHDSPHRCHPDPLPPAAGAT